jgi:Tol biopolymer transport system component
MFRQSEKEIQRLSCGDVASKDNRMDQQKVDPNTDPLDSDDSSWSPNGQQITFKRDIHPTPSPEIFTMNADGSVVVQLTGLTGLYSNGHPGWGRGPTLAR